MSDADVVDAATPLPSIETTIARKILLVVKAESVAVTDVGELLKRSRDCHLLYRRNARHRANGVVIDGDPIAAAAALAAAAQARAEAEVADPLHADPAWNDDRAEKYPHPALLDFYLTQLKP